MSHTIGERARFYLEHQRRIKEWAKLEEEVWSEAHDFFSSLKEPLQAELEALDGNAELFCHLERTEPPKLFLIDPSWRGTGSHPIVGIGLEWATKPSFESGYTGIWLNRFEKARSKELHPRLVDAVCGCLPGCGKRAKPPAYRVGGSWFFATRSEAPTGEYWKEDGLDVFTDDLVDAIKKLWTLCWPSVHEVVSSSKEST